MNRDSGKGVSITCQICGKAAKAGLRKAMIVRPSISDMIRRETGNWDEKGWICTDDLSRFRHLYVEEIVKTEKGELTEIERGGVIDSLHENDILSRNPDMEFEGKLTFGQRMADRIADFGGKLDIYRALRSVLAVWIVINSYLPSSRQFDPFPYILLNLILSCIAAIQAPVIMMSQNRQEARDRARAIHNYQVNLKAELEIRHLHQKVDHLLSHQWERLVEIQEIQMELLGEIEMMREKKVKREKET